MPPRYAYWTILIDNKPTAFRARDKEELQPTFRQLQRNNTDVVMKWFARGRVWDTPEQARWAGSHLEGTREKRGREWRPGGKHEDPRARFDKRKSNSRPGNAPGTAAPRADRSSTKKPATGPEQERQRAAKPPAEGQRPWSPKPPREGQPPWSGKPPREGQRSGRPKPPREGQRPWSAKPPREGQRFWSPKPPGEGQRTWSDKRPRLPQAQRPWTSEPAAKPDDPAWRSKSGTRRPSSDRGPQSRQQSERPFRRDRPPGPRETPVPPKRDGAAPPEKRGHELPEERPAPEKIATKPEPPERG